MPPAKGSKAVPKPVVSPVKKPISKGRTKKKNYLSFSMYLYKVMKSTGKGENIGISRRSMQIMNNFVADMVERLAAEAGRLVAHSGRSTLGSRELQAAVRLLVPGELATHAHIEACKALNKYYLHYGKPTDKKT